MRRTVLLALAVGLAVGGVFIGLLVAGAIGGSSNKEPAEKQALETAQARNDATAQAVAHAPEDSNTTPVPTRNSCPVDTSTVKTEVTGPIHQPPPSSIFDEITLLNEATAVGTDGVPYSLFFGVSNTDSQQGVIVVWQGVKDPCAEGGRTSLDPQKYLVPFNGSPSALTKIDASTVTFQDADGRTGQFNYVNKAFSTAVSQ